MTTYFSNKKHLDRCDNHYGTKRGEKRTLIVHQMYDDVFGDHYKACWRCWWVDPIITKVTSKVKDIFSSPSTIDEEPF